MKLVTLQDALTDFFESPSAQRFLRVRELVTGEDDYRPQASVLLELSDLVQQGEHAAALELAEELMPGWSLCPRVHFLAGMAAEGLGDEEEVELRRFLTQACLDGILSTGDGARRRPWLATYPSDIQDVLARKGVTPASQRLVEGDDAWLSAVTARRAKTFWFDISQMVSAGVEPLETLAAAVSARNL